MAGEKDEYFTLNTGFLFNNTLNATFGYERELNYGNALELFGEVGNKWPGIQFSLIQKNQVSFLHGDSFRNGLLIGLKIPF